MSAGYRKLFSTERLGCIAIEVKSGYCILQYSELSAASNIKTLRPRGKGTSSCKKIFDF